MNYPSIVRVEPQAEYCLRIGFDNGECRKFDVKPLFNCGRFSELRDVSVFEKVRVSFDTIEWDNGLDLDPEYLYERSEACYKTNSPDETEAAVQ